MRVLIIPDKFKGSLTAAEVISAIEAGIQAFDPTIEVSSITASDGGDGFLDSVRQCTDSVETKVVPATDPLGRPINAEFLFDVEAKVAFVEMARASGMELLTPEERNPMRTSTFGTGQLINHAIRCGAKTIYIGLGGSATNDGGIGLANALGFPCVNEAGEAVPPTGAGLEQIHSIQRRFAPDEYAGIQFFAINDVQNPLLGENGAAKIYGPQKGADERMILQLENGLNHLQQIVQRDLKVDVANVPGAGAAGGTGYGLKAFLGAEFLSGIEFVLEMTGAEKRLSGGAIDVIVTGEGRIDDQTAYGKLVRGVAQAGAKHGVPVVAICGALQMESKTIDDLGLKRVIQIHRPDQTLDYTMQNAKQLVKDAASEILAD